MATIRITEAEAARDFAGLMARVRAAAEVVIDDASALQYGYSVATTDLRHFQLIPGLKLVTL